MIICICPAEVAIKVGVVVKRKIRDMDGVPQPLTFLVLREATFAEWVEQLPDPTESELSSGEDEDARFYEIVAD